MTKQELLENFGIESWFDLYIFIDRAGYSMHETVKLTETIKPAPVMGTRDVPLEVTGPRTWTFYVTEIKAKAFDELFPRIPRPESVQLIQEIVGELARFSPLRNSVQDVLSFLNNLPTRKP